MRGDRDHVPPLGPALELMRRLWRVSHELEVLSQRTSRELGITAQQRMTLRVVGRFPGITAGRLSALLCVDAATVSVALSRLEARGLVARERDPRDRRRVTITLTARGRRLDAPTSGTVESAVESVLAHARAADVRATHALLEAISDALAAEARAEPRARRAAR